MRTSLPIVDFIPPIFFLICMIHFLARSIVIKKNYTRQDIKEYEGLKSEITNKILFHVYNYQSQLYGHDYIQMLCLLLHIMMIITSIYITDTYIFVSVTFRNVYVYVVYIYVR